MAPTTAIRKCTVCKNLVKGHLGRAGKGNCTMKPVEEEKPSQGKKKPLEDDKDVTSRGKKNIAEVLESQKTEDVEEEAVEENVEAEPWEDMSTSPLPCVQPAHLARIEECSDMSGPDGDESDVNSTAEIQNLKHYENIFAPRERQLNRTPPIRTVRSPGGARAAAPASQGQRSHELPLQQDTA